MRGGPCFGCWSTAGTGKHERFTRATEKRKGGGGGNLKGATNGEVCFFSFAFL